MTNIDEANAADILGLDPIHLRSNTQRRLTLHHKCMLFYMSARPWDAKTTVVYSSKLKEIMISKNIFAKYLTNCGINCNFLDVN